MPNKWCKANKLPTIPDNTCSTRPDNSQSPPPLLLLLLRSLIGTHPQEQVLSLLCIDQL